MELLNDLVTRARQGDPAAFDRIVERILPEFHRLATLIVGPADADDVCQDALASAWRELPRLRDPERFMPWARRALVNRSRDILRSRRRGVRALELPAWRPDGPEHAPSAGARPNEMTGIEARIDLRQAVLALPPDHREVVALHYAAGLSLVETADALGIAAGTAKSRLHAALEALRRDVGESDR